jgi:hypothetical protein
MPENRLENGEDVRLSELQGIITSPGQDQQSFTLGRTAKDDSLVPAGLSQPSPYEKISNIEFKAARREIQLGNLESQRKTFDHH